MNTYKKSGTLDWRSLKLINLSSKSLQLSVDKVEFKWYVKLHMISENIKMSSLRESNLRLFSRFCSHIKQPIRTLKSNIYRVLIGWYICYQIYTVFWLDNTYFIKYRQCFDWTIHILSNIYSVLIGRYIFYQSRIQMVCKTVVHDFWKIKQMSRLMWVRSHMFSNNFDLIFFHDNTQAICGVLLV